MRSPNTVEDHKMTRWQERLVRAMQPLLITGGLWMSSSTLTADTAPDHQAEWRTQHQALEKQMADRTWSPRVREQVLRQASLILDSDRDPLDVVLRRTAALIEHLNAKEAGKQLAALRNQAEQIAPEQKEQRYALYEKVCELRRRVAFANPLLDFERIVFLKKHRPGRGDHHMVDQYCGFNARAGGGVFVLEKPFSDQPEVVDLLRQHTVANGRLKGRTLDGGSFNTLELDYDANRLLFAYTECVEPGNKDWSQNQPPDWDEARARKLKREHYYWAPETTFNLFQLDLKDGAVTQLTDSVYNEFDPCFLPDGRVAFISERRGGYLRCGGNRPNPTYTLYSMESDGSDIIPLSFHETQEWNPSVDHQGMIAYTRWDYVDRDSDCGHHLWLCYPDGRDPRSYHGNYPTIREHRPWIELGIRAIPGSSKYVAVASPHHGYAYGSLIVIDQSIEDDGAVSQIKRITPEAHFPEAESAPGLPQKKGRHSPQGEFHGTPWPLSEDFHLCVYDSAQKNYGIYLVDSFGNKELIYRDKEIACLDPIPLRPRTRPPVIPRQTSQAAADRERRPQTATVLINNIYEADFPWPADRKVAALRVIQLYPKASWHMDKPMVGIGPQSLTRGVVGEAPVEADGSVYFEAPAGVPIYFQAVDGEGLAIQSMRSATYLHPGEQLSCRGCHESKVHSAPEIPSMAAALKKGPVKLTPPPADAQPVSFPRLVQPVLDRNCVDCHARMTAEGAKPLSGEITDSPYGWSQSYVNLADHAWALHGGNGIIAQNGSRSKPGQLGAKASRLWQLLEKGHHDVELNAEERRRLILWLDLNSNFYGDYMNLEEQQRGEKVVPQLK